MEFQVKVWKQLLLTWHKRTLIIRDTDFQIEKRVKSNITKEVKTYPLYSAVIVDQSKHNDLNILVGNSSYKVFIKPLTKEDKQKIISKLEERIKQFSSQTTFSEDYLRYNEDLLTCFDNSPYGIIVRKLNMFQNLILEMAQKLDNFKTLIQNKHGNTTNYMSLHNNLMTIKEEMKKQFDEIVSSVYNYHDQIEGGDTTVLTKKNYKFNDNIHKENEMYSSEEENDINQNINIEDNIKKNEKRNSLDNDKSKEEKVKKVEEEKKIEDNDNKVIVKKDPKEQKKNPYYFLSDKIEDFHDDNYNFEKRTVLPHKIVCPKNIIKEMITNLTKRLPSPVYFNEPLSMGQKQCEKFKYMDLLIKAGNETSKEMQMCYIAAFIIGELFLNLGRTLKPFNPIIGETFEFFDNEKNFMLIMEILLIQPLLNSLKVLLNYYLKIKLMFIAKKLVTIIFLIHQMFMLKD